MSLLLDSVGSTGASGARRAATVRALFATRARRSVLGTYSIDRRGDTTLTRYGVYRIAAGELRFAGAVAP